MSEAQAQAPDIYESVAHDGLRLSSSAAFILALIAFGLSGGVSLWLGASSPYLLRLGFSGFVVPDAISLEKSVHLAWTSDWSDIPNVRTFMGTVLIYYPTTLFGDAYALAANVTLLALAAVSFNATILRCVGGARRSIAIWLWGVLLVSTNIYIISCLPYPNKEIPLIFLSSVTLFALLRGHWLLAALCIFLCYWFRDGYALILGVVAIVLFCRRITFVSGGIIATLFLVLLLVAFPIQDLSGVDGSLQRNVAIGGAIAGDKFSALGDVLGYGARLVGNAINLGLRPQFFDTQGGIYLLGIGYWQFGVVLLAGLVWSAGRLFSGDNARGGLALAITVTLLGVSYGTFVQPRYMMPLIFILTLGLSDSRLGYYFVIPITVFMPILFFIVGGLPAPVGG